jgi:hypothetical protein
MLNFNNSPDNRLTRSLITIQINIRQTFINIR